MENPNGLPEKPRSKISTKIIIWALAILCLVFAVSAFSPDQDKSKLVEENAGYAQDIQGLNEKLAAQEEKIQNVQALEKSVNDLTYELKLRLQEINDLTYEVNIRQDKIDQLQAAASKPAASSQASTSTTTQKSQTVYITKTGSKYHRAGCQYLSKSKISISLDSAKSQGYSACSKCW